MCMDKPRMIKCYSVIILCKKFRAAAYRIQENENCNEVKWNAALDDVHKFINIIMDDR